jgi:hypothetical protein
MRDVSSWHFSDMPTALGNVRHQGHSKRHLLALSFSGFDPERTWANETVVAD